MDRVLMCTGCFHMHQVLICTGFHASSSDVPVWHQEEQKVKESVVKAEAATKERVTKETEAKEEAKEKLFKSKAEVADKARQEEGEGLRREPNHIWSHRGATHDLVLIP